MLIQEGLVPGFIADRINGRRDDTAVDRKGDSIAESGSAVKPGDPRAEVFPATAAISAPVSTADGDQTVRSSFSPHVPIGGVHLPGWTYSRSQRILGRGTLAVYAPVSATDEDQNQQIAELRAFALQNGWQVQVLRERRARAGTWPVLDQMMFGHPEPEFHALMVASLDCLARSLADLGNHLWRLHGLGIRVIVLRGGSDGLDLDPDTEVGPSFLSHLKTLIKAESNMRARNVRAGVARAQREGVHCGRPQRKFPRAEAAKLQQEGLSIRAIAGRLGVPASTVASELASADNGEDPLAEVFPTETASAEISVPASQPDRTVHWSSSPVGLRFSIESHSSGMFRTKVVVYAPVSAAGEDQDQQIADLCRFAQRNGWEVQVVRELRDRAERADFNPMMRRHSPPKFQVLLVESMDWLARSIPDLRDNLTWLYSLGIRVIVRGEGLDLDPETEAGQSFLCDLTILAKAESNMRARSVRAGLAWAKSQGVHCGRPQRKFPRDQACKLQQEGLSIGAIAARLGVPPSTVADALRHAKAAAVVDSGGHTETNTLRDMPIFR